MDFKKITIDSYASMAHYLSGIKINEYGITPTCLYAPYDSAEFAEYNGFLILRYINEDENKCHSIAGDFSAACLGDILHELYKNDGYLRFELLSPEHKDIIQGYFPDYTICSDTDPDQYDYLYEIEDFLKLSGKKLRHKREHYNNFINNYKFRFEKITDSNKYDCMPIINGWCSRKDCNDCEYCCERNIISNLLADWNKYPTQGGIIYVDNSPAAFLICEPMGDTVMGYHQKTRSSDMKGLSHAVYIETIKNLFSDYKYFNIGPDIGIAGLRQFKHQFKPYTMVEKYSLYIT